MDFVANYFGYVKSGGEEKDESKKLAAIKKLLQEGQTIAGTIETSFTALTHTVSSQMKANDEQEKALQHGQKHKLVMQKLQNNYQTVQVNQALRQEKKQRTSTKETLDRKRLEETLQEERKCFSIKIITFESLVEDVREAIQMNKDWIKKLQEQICEPLKPDSANRFKLLEQESKTPAQRDSELKKDYAVNTAGEKETIGKIKNDSSSIKKVDLAQKRQVVSLLYCPQKVDLVTSVMKKLDEMLSTHLSTHGIDLKMQICESDQDIREGIPLLVICLHSSRLGTDVSNALRGIRTGPNVGVIVVHHKDIHALPSTSSGKILTAQEFQRIGSIVDMGFLSQKGFYACDINKKAIEALTSFIAGRKGM